MARQRVDALDAPSPPHVLKDERYGCQCTACDSWRARRVKPGVVVKPLTFDPNRMVPGTTSAWSLGEWKKTGWSFRMQDHGITHATVLGYVDEDDINNGGHLDCVVMLCCDEKLRVTSRKWLCVIV